MELDLAIRQSRSIYITLAIVLLPVAAGGALYVFEGIEAIAVSVWEGYFPLRLGNAIFVIVLGVVFIAADGVMVSQVLEANRRLKTLREHPDRAVRDLPAPFRSSLFGPYH